MNDFDNSPPLWAAITLFFVAAIELFFLGATLWRFLT